MSSLNIEQLTIGYGDKIIASDINLELPQGRLICLLGQNGVGKSTLLRTLSNLQEPLGGVISIEGQPIEQLDRRELAKKLGIITTEKIGMSGMTVRELVALGRYPYTNWIGQESDEDRRKINESISKCQINYIENAKLAAISDGQFQKAMVARVLAQDTDLILMDEPTAHLDVVNRVEMFHLLQTIKAETGKSILISTHELDLSMQFADELWLMNFNQPIQTGTPEDLGLSGKIEEVFYHDQFQLDSLSGRVKLNLEPSVNFKLVGDPFAAEWVEKALLRKGFGVDKLGKTIQCHQKDEGIYWKIEDKEGNSIEKLLNYLKSYESN